MKYKALESKSKKPKRRVLLLFLMFMIVGTSFIGYEYSKFISRIVTTNDNKHADAIINLNTKNSIVEADNLSEFQKPGDGRLNILLLGIGGVSDSGDPHDGTLLTDTIEVASIDNLNKTIGLNSVPRDFQVSISGHGQSKINATYEYAEVHKTGTGGQAARDMVGTILGINISNYILIDFTAAKEIVDLVGGIDIDVPKSLYDATYPCDDQIHYCPYTISAGHHHMDGEAALKYMRTRHVDLDFGRSQRQQEVMQAMRTRILSIGTLSNPVTVIRIIKSLGSHVKTDLQTNQITSLVAELKDVPGDNISSHVLDSASGLVSGRTDPYIGDVLNPIAGLTNYEAIHEWFQKNNPDPIITKEAPTVSVVNDGLAASAFQALITELNAYGFVTRTIDQTISPNISATKSTALATEFFKKNLNSKLVSSQYLSSLLKISPVSVTSGDFSTDFEIIARKGIGTIKSPTPPPDIKPTGTALELKP